MGDQAKYYFYAEKCNVSSVLNKAQNSFILSISPLNTRGSSKWPRTCTIEPPKGAKYSKLSISK